MDTARFSCFAVAAPGLEPLVAKELRALGERPQADDGGVAWDGDALSLMRANLWLRTASRVVVRVASFRATAFHELERHARAVPWDRFLTRGVRPEFRVTARKSRLYHSDAIAERLTRAAERVVPPSADADAPTQLFVVRVHRDAMSVSADSSGELLHLRGYRQATGKAPLRETLAAALLLGADWDGVPPHALFDPLCGSGTIPIEAAMLARRIAPGLHREFAFQRWPAHDADVWRALRDDAARQVLARAPVAIVGADRDPGAIVASRANAERAGVAGDIEWLHQPLSAAKAPAETGLLATNPPYGKRVGGGAGDVRNLYAQFGNVAREGFAGWRVALYSPEPRLTAQLALPVEPAFDTSNGGIRVSAMVGTARL